MMFVAIHELAHVMTKSIGHTEEFGIIWDILKKGISGVYNNENYKDNPKLFGTQ